MKNVALFFLLILSLSSAFANPKVDAFFEEYFYSSELSSRHCDENISKFIKALGRKGLYSPEIKVISFTAPSHSWSMGHVVALNSRWGREKDGSYHENWYYHVIAILEGRVFDFSFNKVPRVLPLKQYIREMFIPQKPVAINGMTFRVQGKGPYYTEKDAWDEMDYYEFKIMDSDSSGKLNVGSRKMNLTELKAQLGL